MIPADDPFALAQLFHVNSQAWSDDGTALEEYFPVHYADAPGAEPPVPLPQILTSPVVELLRRRRSCRRYRRRLLPGAHLAALLFGAGGLIGLSEYAPGLSLARRATPSAGGLLPLEIHVVVERVRGVDDGLYRFNATSRTLQPQRAGPFLNVLGPLFLDQAYLDDANVVLVLTAAMERTLRKYGSRGYRYVLLEAGHAAQNVCLLATELGLDSLCIGGFGDNELNDFLGLDGIQRAALYCVGCGYGAA